MSGLPQGAGRNLSFPVDHYGPKHLGNTTPHSIALLRLSVVLVVLHYLLYPGIATEH